jgi:hypothetical protein
VIHSPSRWSEALSLPERHFSYYPFFLATLSSLLKKETSLRVRLVDGCLERLDERAYLHKILALEPRYLLVESASLTYPENRDLALQVKKRLGTRLLFCGAHVTAFPRQALADGIDFVFRGEFVQSVYRFFREGEKRSVCRIREPEDAPAFEDMPWPEDEDVSRMDYGEPGEPSSRYREIQIYATRGCRGRCSYCVARHLYYRTSRHACRDPLDVCREMESLKRKYPSLEGFFFDEEDHFSDPGFLRDFCNILVSRKNRLAIEALGKMEHVPLGLLPRMREAGYYQLRVGGESFHPAIRRFSGKRFTTDLLERFLAGCRNHGIAVYMSFQVGLPGSTVERDLFTLSRLKQYLEDGRIANAQISLFTPFPGTPAHRIVLKHGAFADRDLSRYNGGARAVVHWPSYPAKEIEAVYRRFVLTRDHVLLKKRLRSGKSLAWLWDRARKNPPGVLVKKIRRRIAAEREYRRLAGI